MVVDRIAAGKAGIRNRKEARGRLPERAFALFWIHFAGKAVAGVDGGERGNTRRRERRQPKADRCVSAAVQQKKGVGRGEVLCREDGHRASRAEKRAGAPVTARKEWAKA